jgi:hypothetical protein
MRPALLLLLHSHHRSRGLHLGYGHTGCHSTVDLALLLLLLLHAAAAADQG